MKHLLLALLLFPSALVLADESLPSSEPSAAYINLNSGFATLQNLPTGEWTGSLNAGYNFNPYFALEGGYTLLAGSQFGATATSSIFDVAAKGRLAFSEVFSLYGRAGIAYGVDGWSGAAAGTPSWLCTSQYNANYAAGLVGVGGSFALSKHFDLRVEDYAFIPFSNTMNGGINIVTFGTQYNF